MSFQVSFFKKISYYHFYFKNSQPVYETEYMQKLKQFAVQEVFPAYVCP